MISKETKKCPYLLASMPHMNDEHFAKSLVLIIDHSRHGAFGFVMNRPTPVPMAELVQIPELMIPPEIPTWFGGPIGQESGVVIGLDSTTLEGEPEIAISGTHDLIGKMVRKMSLITHRVAMPEVTDVPEIYYPYRFIVGYSGWGPHQLDEELRSGMWMELPLNYKLLFGTPWSEMWQNSILALGARPDNMIGAIQNYLN